MALVLKTPPAADVLPLDEAKAHLRVLGSDEDALITGLIAVALAMVDGESGILGRALITQSWDLYLDAFPVKFDDAPGTYAPCSQPILLPLAPLQSVTAIAYIDENGAQQILAADQYQVDDKSTPPRLLPAYGLSWPMAKRMPNAVKISGVYGYGAAAANVPAPIVHAMKLIVGHLYQNREMTTEAALKALPAGVSMLLACYRVAAF